MNKKEFDDLNFRLKAEFARLNNERFDGVIEDYDVRFAKRSVRTHGSINFYRKAIRVSLPLFEQHGWELVIQTLIHEMTHALIHQQGGQARHSKRFWQEFKRRGGVRDRINVKPKTCYVYACPTCGEEFERLRKLKGLRSYSCSICDKEYNPQHKLYLKRDMSQMKLE